VKLGQIWRELEEAGPVGGAGRLQRRVEAGSKMDLHIELVLPERHRAVSLTVAASAAAGHEDPPEAAGLRHTANPGGAGGTVTFSLELIDRAATDLFEVLAEDLVESVAAAGDDPEGVGAWTGRIARWQHLLRRAPQGLAPELQRALMAELWILRELLAPSAGVAAAVRAWQGPTRSRHDFQLPLTSLEVKSCAANQPQVVSINGERQLDEVGTPALHLAHVSLDVHHNGPESLPEMVASVREMAAGSGVEVELEDSLLDFGFIDRHAPRYAGTGYNVRESRFFRITPGFPRLTEADLPEGVGGLHYRLAIAACAEFEVDEEAVGNLAGGGG
jgi:Putative  PD-(D/E)XK family member, (DUF4420)